MKDILIPGLKLLLIALVSALFLALINIVTEPIIEKNKQDALADALTTVVEEGKAGDFKSIDNKIVTGYYPIQAQDERKGYILRLIGEGYGGDLVILASYTMEGEVIKVKLLEDSETPGLGKEAEKDEYMAVFENTGISKPIPLWKSDLPQERVEAISGASVTYYGVAQAVNAGSDIIKNGLEAAE